MTDNARAIIAEFFGTFTLVFIGALTGALAGTSGSGLVGVALAHGVALLVIIYTWGSVSGAHVNPAVTLGVLVGGRMPVGKAIGYWIAQFAGGIVAALLLHYLIGIEGALGSTTGSFTETSPVKTIVVEGVLTFFLVLAVYASGVLGRNGNLAGVGIGLVLTMDILAGGPLTGASMNPARTLGPALAMNNLGYVWMYFVGPFAGAIVAVLLYEHVIVVGASKTPTKS